MGARGSFSEEAARKYIEDEGISDTQIEYLISADRVLGGLEAGEIDVGIFPIENSNGGIVIEAVHAMARYRFTVEKIFEIEVQQNLLVRRGISREDITTITSHDQALKQCRMYLKRAWSGMDLVEYADTAKAAEDLANGTLPETTAVIASKVASEIYGLEILEKSIQDLKFNYTSFVVARHRAV